VLEIAESPEIAKRYWLTRQICACAMSVPANIAEGSGRGTNADFASFVDRSRGSLFELDVWIRMCRRRGFVSESREQEVLTRILELNAMLYSLRNNLRARTKDDQRRGG
jgi:four helix bundle protein